MLEQGLSESNTPQKWSRIVEIVEKANLNRKRTVNDQEKYRKEMYKHQLDTQVDQLHQKEAFIRQEKERERLQANHQAELQKHNEQMGKFYKMKSELKYCQDNLHLSQINPQRRRLLTRRDGCDSDSAYDESKNPFIRLVNQQDARAQETKRNFRVQNQLNDVQVEIIRDKRTRNLERQRRERELFERHVQEEGKKRDRYRSLFKEKYLNINRGQSQAIGFNQNIAGDKYAQFLNHQISQNQERKKLESDSLDMKLSRINRHIAEPDSSPAFLGRNVASHDREKQLRIIDNSFMKQLPNKQHQRYQSVALAEQIRHSQAQQIQKRSRRELTYLNKQLDHQRLYYSPQPQRVCLPKVSQTRQNNGNEQQKLEPRFEPRSEPRPQPQPRPQHHVTEPSLLSSERNKGQPNPQECREKRVYRRYDIISGKQKTVQI